MKMPNITYVSIYGRMYIIKHSGQPMKYSQYELKRDPSYETNSI